MEDALHDCERRLEDIRDVMHRAAWLASRIRQRCLETEALPGAAPVISPAEDGPAFEIPAGADPVIRGFQALPELERSALGLFYLELFTPEQIAQILGIKLEELAEVLRSARIQLQSALKIQSEAQ